RRNSGARYRVSPERRGGGGARRAARTPDRRAARALRPARRQAFVRHRRVRRVHGAGRRPARDQLVDARVRRRRARSDDHRGAGARRPARSRAAGVRRARRDAMRLLHPGHGVGGEGTARRQPQAHGGGSAALPPWQPVPLYRLRQDHRSRDVPCPHQERASMKKTIPRIVVGAALALGRSAGAAAQSDFPNKPVHIIVPYSAGGATDILARLMADEMAKRLGQPVVVENKPGAGGAVGTTYAANAKPDGYTIQFGNLGPNAINPSIYDNLQYDPAKDLVAISNVADTPFILVVPPEVPAKSVKELIALGKKEPGKHFFASV